MGFEAFGKDMETLDSLPVPLERGGGDAPIHYTAICLSPLEQNIFPVVIDSLQNQQGKVKQILEQMEV